MDSNDFHLILQSGPDVATTWDDTDVVRRSIFGLNWMTVFSHPMLFDRLEFREESVSEDSDSVVHHPNFTHGQRTSPISVYSPFP